jgi:transposase
VKRERLDFLADNPHYTKRFAYRAATIKDVAADLKLDWHTGSLGFVEGLNSKIRVIQRCAYGLRGEEVSTPQILTCMLPEL